MRQSPGRDAARSPWPFLAALGLAVAELGVFAGSEPVSVFGLVLLGGSSAGLVHEAGYSRSPARPMQVVGGLFAVGGGALWLVQAPAATPAALLAATLTDGLARHGMAALVAGGLLVALGLVGGRLSAFR